VTTLVRALEAVGRGDPLALRACVDAIGDALLVLREEGEDSAPATVAEVTTSITDIRTPKRRTPR
jgi:hypothetical protein